MDDFKTGDWIRAELRLKGWKVEELARNSGIGLRLIQKYLAGTEPGAQNLARILMALGYDVPWSEHTRVFLERILSTSRRSA